MPALHIRNVPEHLMAALREHAELHGHSTQQEVLKILEAAAAEPVTGRPPPPLRLVTVKTSGASTWRRKEIYGAEGR